MAVDITQSTALSFHLDSPSCQTVFRMSRGIIEEVVDVSRTTSGPLATPSPSSKNLLTSSMQEQADNDALDMQYFRRFLIMVPRFCITKGRMKGRVDLMLCYWQ